MKNFFFASLLLFLSFQTWANTFEPTTKQTYQELKPYLELLKIKSNQSAYWRKAIALLDINGKVKIGNWMLERTGKFSDELLIKSTYIQITIPEWSLLEYLTELEDEVETALARRRRFAEL
jgi:hypothetical protein